MKCWLLFAFSLPVISSGHAATLSECDDATVAKNSQQLETRLICDTPVKIVYRKRGTVFFAGTYLKIKTVTNVTCYIHLPRSEFNTDEIMEQDKARQFFTDDNIPSEALGEEDLRVRVINMSPDLMPSILGLEFDKRPRDANGPVDHLAAGTYKCALVEKDQAAPVHSFRF